jgi:hypothetical protein
MREPCPNVFQNFVRKKHGSLIPDEILVGLIQNEGTPRSKLIRNEGTLPPMFSRIL